MASAVGMGLAVAGATLQALFSNPLCEPYTLGISSGSALGAVIGLTLGLEWNLGGFIGTAFLGALGFAILLRWIAHRFIRNSSSLLLVGVMLGFLGMSLVALWISFSDANGISGVLIWLFGDLSRSRIQGSVSAAGAIAGLVVMIWRYWRELDALLIGEEEAIALGVDAPRVRGKLIILTSLLVGTCVSFSGMIGFLGLMVPHYCRRWVGSLHWFLIPLCAVWGATTLVIADTLARVLARPYELPVGIVTSLIGVPVFLLVMLNKQEAA